MLEVSNSSHVGDPGLNNPQMLTTVIDETTKNTLGSQ